MGNGEIQVFPITLSIVNQILGSCNISQTQKIRLNFCNSCQWAKSHKLHFSMSSSITVKPFDLIHTDLWGHSLVRSIFGARHFFLCIDDHTHFTWFYLLKTKDETYPTFLKFQALIGNQFNTKIKVVQFDWGSEFQSLSILFSNIGIVYRLSCPYTSQQNGWVEQKNCHVVEMGLSFLAHSGLPYFTSLMPFRLPPTLLIVSRPLFCIINPLTSLSITKSQLIIIWRFLVPLVFHIYALIIPINSNTGH